MLLCKAVDRIKTCRYEISGYVGTKIGVILLMSEYLYKLGNTHLNSGTCLFKMICFCDLLDDDLFVLIIIVFLNLKLV